jgi:hypothetical protein
LTGYDWGMDNLPLIAAAGAFVIVLIPLLWISTKKQLSRINELKEQYQQSIELNQRNLELQVEAIAVMRELIEALRAKK